MAPFVSRSIIAIGTAVLLTGSGACARKHSANHIQSDSIVSSSPARATEVPTEPFDRYEYSRIIMGSRARIVLYAETESAARGAASEAFDRMIELDDVMSDYRLDSEAMRATRAGANATAANAIAVPVSRTLAAIVEESRNWYDVSGGAFDVTIGPMSALWRDAQRTGTQPDMNRRALAMQSVGQHRLGRSDLSTSNSTPGIVFHAPNMRLDFGAIGKGIAVDESFRIIRDQCGIESVLIDFGGDLRVGAPPPGRDAWSVAVQTHDANPSDGVLHIANRAIATSGDLERFVEIDGVRYSHILDPHTGMGLRTRIAVTVISDDATSADALATTLSVLGPSKAGRFLRRFPNAQARIAQVTPTALRLVWSTPGFPPADH